MKRNEGVEAIRGIAILMMLFYHYTKLIGNLMENGKLPIIDEGICQMALLFFFAISGYGTFKYLEKRDIRDIGIWGGYAMKRIKKLTPFYYLSILIIILTTKTYLISKKGILSVIINCCFLQNIFENYNNINGVTWTIALMVQFYMLAVPLYKCIKRNKYITYVVMLLICSVITWILCGYVERNNLPVIYDVYIHMRQICTTLDVFALGMLVGAMPSVKNGIGKGWGIGFILSLCLISQVCFVYIIIWAGGIYGSGIKYLVWKPVLSLFVAVIIYVADNMPMQKLYMPEKIILFVAKYELGIYIWHVILQNNLAENSEFYERLKTDNPWILLLIMCLFISLLGAGYIRLVSLEKQQRLFH